MAVSRYDHCLELVVKEADAIGNDYLRAATLGQPYPGKRGAFTAQLCRCAKIDFFAAGFRPTRLKTGYEVVAVVFNKSCGRMWLLSLQRDRTSVIYGVL